MYLFSAFFTKIERASRAQSLELEVVGLFRFWIFGLLLEFQGCWLTVSVNGLGLHVYKVPC